MVVAAAFAFLLMILLPLLLVLGTYLKVQRQAFSSGVAALLNSTPNRASGQHQLVPNP